ASRPSWRGGPAARRPPDRLRRARGRRLRLKGVCGGPWGHRGTPGRLEGTLHHAARPGSPSSRGRPVSDVLGFPFYRAPPRRLPPGRPMVVDKELIEHSIKMAAAEDEGDRAAFGVWSSSAPRVSSLWPPKGRWITSTPSLVKT